ncbi:MAG: hypothetical protein ACREIV_05660, partial [Planctomycetaceae bacterium]
LETWPADWLRLIGVTVLGAVEIIDADLSTITAEADKVFRLSEPEPWLLHLEAQSGYDASLPDRMLLYNVLLTHRHGCPVQSAALLLHRKAKGSKVSGRLARQHPDGLYLQGGFNGRTRTYDFRGRKVAVVMAGNPYTESGEKFQIPDMLANRADIHNLGEIIGDNAQAFEMSYLENALTSNPTLNNLAMRSQKDVYIIVHMAEHGDRGDRELEGSYSTEELNETVTVMKKLMTVRDVILKVNRAYIHSAAQSDDYRTEPPFRLQGSYRNMNRIAERVSPIMNDQELQTLILSSYENDAQTLTTGAEANLLKFKELMGLLTEPEARRWEEIKTTFRRNVKLRGIGPDDKIGQVIVQLSSFGEGLDGIREAMAEGVSRLSRHNGEPQNPQVGELIASLRDLREGLGAIQATLSGGLDRSDPLQRIAGGSNEEESG